MHLVVAASKGVFMPAFAVAPQALPPSFDAVLRPCELAARRLALAAARPKCSNECPNSCYLTDKCKF